MKNVPGWEVGTWYGEPVYKLLPKDTLVDPHFKDFYAHTDYKHLGRRYNMKMWNQAEAWDKSRETGRKSQFMFIERNLTIYSYLIEIQKKMCVAR